MIVVLYISAANTFPEQLWQIPLSDNAPGCAMLALPERRTREARAPARLTCVNVVFVSSTLANAIAPKCSNALSVSARTNTQRMPCYPTGAPTNTPLPARTAQVQVYHGRVERERAREERGTRTVDVAVLEVELGHALGNSRQRPSDNVVGHGAPTVHAQLHGTGDHKSKLEHVMFRQSPLRVHGASARV